MYAGNNCGECKEKLMEWVDKEVFRCKDCKVWLKSTDKKCPYCHGEIEKAVVKVMDVVDFVCSKCGYKDSSLRVPRNEQGQVVLCKHCS